MLELLYGKELHYSNNSDLCVAIIESTNYSSDLFGGKEKFGIVHINFTEIIPPKLNLMGDWWLCRTVSISDKRAETTVFISCQIINPEESVKISKFSYLK